LFISPLKLFLYQDFAPGGVRAAEGGGWSK